MDPSAFLKGLQGSKLGHAAQAGRHTKRHQSHRRALDMGLMSISLLSSLQCDRSVAIRRLNLLIDWPDCQQVAWLDSEFGGNLATSCGHVLRVWHQVATTSGAAEWRLQDTLQDVEAPLVALCFAPKQHSGPWLAAASVGGAVR